MSISWTRREAPPPPRDDAEPAPPPARAPAARLRPGPSALIPRPHRSET